MKALVSGTKSDTDVHLWRAPEKREDGVELSTGSAVCLSPKPGIHEEFSHASECHVGGTAHSPQGFKSLHSPQHADTGGQKGPCVKMAIFSGSPLLFEG